MTSPPDSRRFSNLTSLSLQESLSQQEDELSATVNDTDQDYSDVSLSRFCTSARSDEDINVSRLVIRQDDCPEINKDLQKLREVAVLSLSTVSVYFPLKTVIANWQALMTRLCVSLSSSVEYRNLICSMSSTYILLFPLLLVIFCLSSPLFRKLILELRTSSTTVWPRL